MAKTVTTEANASQKNEKRRQRKKQARREAKMMLKIDQAKKAVQKAQKKLTQAQSNFDDEQTRLHDIEAKLQQLRTGQEAEAQETPVSQDSSSEEEQVQISSEELPDLKPEDFHIQEVVDETYQEPLLMPTTSLPQADTEAIEAFHTASIIPVEGRDDVASEVETDQTQEAEQAAQQVIDAQTEATFEPAEGRSDLSTDQTIDTPSAEGQDESNVSSDPSNELSVSPDAPAETDAATPEEHKATTRTRRRSSQHNTYADTKESDQEKDQ